MTLIEKAVEYFNSLATYVMRTDGLTQVSFKPEYQHIFFKNNVSIVCANDSRHQAETVAGVVATTFTSNFFAMVSDLNAVPLSRMPVERINSILSAYTARLDSMEDALGDFNTVVIYTKALFTIRQERDYVMRGLLAVKNALHHIEEFNRIYELSDQASDRMRRAMCLDEVSKIDYHAVDLNSLTNLRSLYEGEKTEVM